MREIVQPLKNLFSNFVYSLSLLVLYIFRRLARRVGSNYSAEPQHAIMAGFADEWRAHFRLTPTTAVLAQPGQLEPSFIDPRAQSWHPLDPMPKPHHGERPSNHFTTTA